MMFNTLYIRKNYYELDDDLLGIGADSDQGTFYNVHDISSNSIKFIGTQ